MSAVPSGKPVQLLMRDDMCGSYESDGAYLLKNEFWYLADPEMLMHSPPAIAWRPWTKPALRALPKPSRGRRG